jgi:hypothetical protein
MEERTGNRKLTLAGDASDDKSEQDTPGNQERQKGAQKMRS